MVILNSARLAFWGHPRLFSVLWFRSFAHHERKPKQLLTRDSACACPVAPPKAFAFVQDLIFGQGPKAPSHMRGSFWFSVYRVAWRLYIGLLGQAW